MAVGGRVLGGQGLAHEFYGGGSVSSLAPYSFPLSIGEFPFQLDYSYAGSEALEYGSYPQLREQADQSNRPGIQSLSRDGIWRQNQVSWHLGAGQVTFDREGNSEFRFRNSLGFDIWTKYRLSFLPQTDEKRASANTNLRLAVAGSRLYFTDGTEVRYTTDTNVDTWATTNVTGSSGVAPTSICSDGFNVWTAHVAGGVDRTNNTINTKASQITGTVSLIAYVRGRVIACHNNIIYDVTGQAYNAAPPVPLPTAHFTHPNSNFTWKAIAEGRNAIYIAGYSGDKSQIYRMAIKSDGTGLDQPIVCAEFDGTPDQIEGLYGYLGPFLFIGQAKGWRFARIQDSADLEVGARVPTPNPVFCFEGQENFVWWGYGNFDSTHTGLGRLNVQEFGNPDQLVPAWASDLQALNEQGDVLSVVTFGEKRVFSVSGQGFFGHHHSGNLFPGGSGLDQAYLDTGEICFNLYEPKVGLFFDSTFKLDTGAFMGVKVKVDDEASFNDLGTALGSQNSWGLSGTKNDTFEFRIYAGNLFVATANAIIKSWMMRCIPAPAKTAYWRLPLLIAGVVTDLDGNDHDEYSPEAQRIYINSLHHNKDIVSLRLMGTSFPITVEDCKWRIHHFADLELGRDFNGTALVELKVMEA